MERPSAKVCGYVVSRFNSLRCLKAEQPLRGCIEARRSLDLGGTFWPFSTVLIWC